MKNKILFIDGVKLLSNRTFALLHFVDQSSLDFYHDRQRLHRQIQIPSEILDDIQLRCLRIDFLPRRNPFPAKISAYNVRYKTPFFLRDSSWSPLVYLRLESREIVFIPLQIPRKWIFLEYLQLRHFYLFIYFSQLSYEQATVRIHKIREYSRGKLLSLMLMFYAWQFDDTWPRVSIISGREFPPMEDRRTVGEHWNIFRQHHRGIVRMKFSRSGSNPPSHPWDKKGTRFVYEAKLSKGGQGM